jgi:hypothetical protein
MPTVGPADTHPDEDPLDLITIELGLMAAICPVCEVPREPGPCPDCGTEVPVSEEVAEGVKARRAALTGLPERIAAVEAGFGELPAGAIPLSNDQFATVVDDVGLFGLIVDLLGLGEELEGLALDDPAMIGGRLRRLIEARISRAEALLGACGELALFDPHGPAAVLRDYAARTGHFGVRLTGLYVEVLTASDIREVRAAESQMQGMVDEFRELNGAMPALFEEMEGWILRDVDARISIVLGEPGVYTDEYGDVDVARVFGAFGARESPYEILAARARRYFGHLLGEAPPDVAFESLLIFAAIAIGTLDRPLGPLRIAAGVRDLMLGALAVDPAGAQQLVDRTMSEGALVFAAGERIRRGFGLLRLAEASGEVVEEQVLATVLGAYVELAEGAYRTYGWMLLDASLLRRGEPASATDRPPSLGELGQRLGAVGEEAIGRFAAAADGDLRNAIAHAQYRWEAETAEIVDLRSGRRWDLAALEAATEVLIEAAIGADAGYGCLLASPAVDLKPPRWLLEGRDARAYRPIAEACFGALGFEVAGVEDAGATVVVSGLEGLDRARLLGPLYGLAAVVGRAEEFRVRGPDGEVLVDVSAAAFEELREAPERVRDLATLGPLVDDMVRRGASTGRVLASILPMQLSLVIAGEMDAMGEEGLSTASMLRLADRLQFVLSFNRSRIPAEERFLRDVLKRVSRARALATAAGRGVEGASAELADELLALLRWTQENGTDWPGEDLIAAERG